MSGKIGVECLACGNNAKSVLALNKKSSVETKLGTSKKLSSGNALLATFASVHVGFAHGVGLTETGQVYSWGDNTYNQLGYESAGKGTVVGDVLPVAGLSEQIVQVACGIAHSLALTAKGDIWSWGDNRFGQLGHGDKGPRKTPARVIAAVAPDVVAIHAAFNTSAFITKQGELYVWGWVPGRAGMQMTPVSVGFPQPIVQVAIGCRHLLALTADGDVMSWGWNDFCQLGHGDRAPLDHPTRIDTFAGVRVTSIAAGANFSLAVISDGQVYGWGEGVALGLDGEERIGPTLVNAYRALSVRKLVCGWSHVLALTTTGDVYAVGSNQFGQLGLGSKKDAVTPTQLKGVSAFDVCAGPHSTFVLTGDRPLAEPVKMATLIEKKRTTFVQPLPPSMVWVGTYNVGGQKAVDANLRDWFPRTAPSLVVVGLQEVVDLKRVSDHVISSKQLNHAGVEWRKKIEATLALRYPDRYFVQVLPDATFDTEMAELQMVGMVMFVFVDSEKDVYISDVEYGRIGRGKGIAEVLKGYKGAVALRLRFNHTSIALINCHLAAHLERMEKRNEDYQAIATNIEFPSQQLLFDTQCIFWFGDLNYRIDLPLDKTKVLIGDGNWAELSKYDQLARVIRDGKAFSGMQEAPISFPPTYKYDLGMNIYDTSAKHRVPAWCDRILWKGARITCESYGRAELFLSDHRPVYATFFLDHTDREEYEVMASALRPAPMSKRRSVATVSPAPPGLELPPRLPDA